MAYDVLELPKTLPDHGSPSPQDRSPSSWRMTRVPRPVRSCAIDVMVPCTTMLSPAFRCSIESTSAIDRGRRICHVANTATTMAIAARRAINFRRRRFGRATAGLVGDLSTDPSLPEGGLSFWRSGYDTMLDRGGPTMR